MMKRRSFLTGLPLAVAGCSAVSVWAPDDVVARAAYVYDGPPALSLFTVRNNGDNSGAHTALMINASQRVIFDPAGSFGLPTIPERNDVVFGITPQIEAFYISYHARQSYHVIRQKIEVPAEVAEQALRISLAYGAVARGYCTRATSDIMRQLPGFESLRVMWFPGNLMAAVQRWPGVEAEFFYEDDDDDKEIARAAFDALIRGEAQ